MTLERQVIVVDETTVEVVEVAAQGPQGQPGEQHVVIGPDPPVAPPDTYLWVQTGLGVGGDGFTFWLEDGS